ncbi:13060_t:CDS:10 [Ambispora leptoticha]|uniref:13060_t:CDS:1 n=1 Tax=Ambispora leptoticha TaxID=144679 RepID=A0A9N8V320_9GLOM|nr:13060_t:CDS:10 [Ambispora leptoticha]
MSLNKVKEIVFLGTGTSSGVPSIICLTAPEQACKTCISTLNESGQVNVRRNTSLLIRVNNPDGRLRNILIDCGKTFYVSALKWFPHYKLRYIDALVLTHAHADAINGLDDLRAWTFNKAIQEYIPIYLSNDTKTALEQTFPYIMDNSLATGGGDLPSFQFRTIDSSTPFVVEGLEFIPLPVHHGVHFTSKEPFINLGFRFDNITYISDCNFIPEQTQEKIKGSKLFILDALSHKEHLSHFSVDQAVETTRVLCPKPKRTYLVGFSHKIEHYDLEREMKELQEKEPDLWCLTKFRSPKMSLGNVISVSDSNKELDGEEELFVQSLPVSELPIKHVNKPPSSGAEYLRMVRQEAVKIPYVFTASQPSLHNNQNKAAEWVKRGWEAGEVLKSDSLEIVKLLPRREWENLFINKFEKLRKALRLFISKNFNRFPPSSGIRLPKWHAEADWYKFCYGVDLPTKKREHLKKNVNEIGNLPSLSVISQLDQQTTLSLLSYHTKWLEITGITKEQSRWIFALFLRVDQLLTSDQMSILRELCRRCIEIRKSMRSKDDQNLPAANIFITIVTRYFGQKDLQ